MLFDTHVHFDLLTDADGAIARAFDGGVGSMVAVGGSQCGNKVAVEIAGKYQGRILAAVGFDREHASVKIDFEAFETFARENRVCAIGEVGLDYHYHPETAVVQKELLGRMFRIAKILNLPVIIHSREADADTLEILTKNSGIRGVVHCFTGDWNFAEKLVALGFYISFSGILTFQNAVQVREAARAVPDHRLLIETDTPYLAPVP